MQPPYCSFNMISLFTSNLQTGMEVVGIELVVAVMIGVYMTHNIGANDVATILVQPGVQKTLTYGFH